MVFEDEFMETQLKIISLFMENVNDKVKSIYIYNDEYTFMIASGFNIDGNVVGNLEAGISDDTNEKIYDTMLYEFLFE